MSDLPTAANPRLDALHEAYRRGILPPDRRGAYEEAIKRGLIDRPATQPSGVMQAGGAIAPEARPAADTEIGIGLETPGAAPAMPEGNPATMAGSARGVADLAIDRSRDLKGEMRLLQGYDPSVDYDTGTGWTDAVAMHRSDNPAEKRVYLARKYGPENVFTDRGGRFVVRGPEGKLLSPEGTGFMNRFMQGGAALYADAPMVAGAMGGAMTGAGPLGAIAGAMAGSALGKTAIEGSKVVGGEFDKSLPETAGAIGAAGLLGGAGEGAGRLVTGIPGALGGAFRKYITRSTPEGRDLAASVARSGGVAPLRSVTPGLSSPIQKQDISAKLGSDFLEDRNRAAVQSRLGEIVESQFPASERASVLGEVLDPTARVSAREAGGVVQQDVRLHGAQLEADVDNLARDADRTLQRQLGGLTAISRRAPAGDLGADVAAGIAQARQDFGRSMQNIYAQVDRAIAPSQRPSGPQFAPNREATDDALFGVPSANVGAPIQEFPGVVPTGAIKREARRILDALPKDAQGNTIFGDPRVLKSLGQLRDLGPKMTLGDAQRIRSTLGEMGEFTDLTPGIAKRQFDDLRQSVNTAIGLAANDPAAAPAIRMLRRADQMYHEGVRKFEDATINQIASQAKTGMMPDPGAIADKVLQPKFTARAREIRQMVGPDVWRRVASADWENVMQAARDPQTGEVAARKLATLIQQKDRNGLLELTYGPGLARDMRLYSRRMDARGGKIPAEALTPDNFSQTMRQLETANLSRDAFLQRNYLSELEKPGAAADDAINFVLRPGQESKLIEAQRFFGDDSPQMTAIRQQGLKELLNSAIVRSDTGSTTTIAGDGIDNALKRWTPRQQEIMFPDGLADDMRRLAQEIRFMFPIRRDQMSGGLIAGEIKNLPLSLRIPGGRIPMTAYYEGMGWLYSRPQVVRMLAEGLRPTPSGREVLSAAGAAMRGAPGGDMPPGMTRAAARETIRTIFREAAIGQLPNPNEEPEPGVSTSSGDAMARLMGRRPGTPAVRPPSGLRPFPRRDERQPRPSVGGP